MSELPMGWVEATLDDIATWGSGGTPKSTFSKYYGGGVPWVVTGDLTDGIVRETANSLSEEGLANSSAKLVPPGTVLVAMYGASIGRVGIAGTALASNQAVANAQVYEGVTAPKYVMYYLLSQRTELARAGKGAAQPNIGQGILKTWPIPIAPLAEQARIVAAIEEQFSRLDAGVAALERVRQNLKRMRAAVLQAAVTGQLAEPVEVSRRSRMAEAATLPSDWRLVSVGDVAEVSGGITKNPKRRPQSNAVPFLRVANVHRDKLDLAEVHEIEVFDGELERLRLRAGDLLVVEGNGSQDQIGRCALWHGEIDPCVHQNHLIRVRPNSHVMPEYLNLFWNAPSSTTMIQAAASSTSGLHTLSIGKVRSISVALPPLEVQRCIVDEVKRQLSFVDALENIIHHQLLQSRGLRSSILASAFSGKLVPQDPSDEPASALLERIAAKQESMKRQKA